MMAACLYAHSWGRHGGMAKFEVSLDIQPGLYGEIRLQKTQFIHVFGILKRLSSMKTLHIKISLSEGCETNSDFTERKD